MFFVTKCFDDNGLVKVQWDIFAPFHVSIFTRSLRDEEALTLKEM